MIQPRHQSLLKQRCILLRCDCYQLPRFIEYCFDEHWNDRTRDYEALSNMLEDHHVQGAPKKYLQVFFTSKINYVSPNADATPKGSARGSNQIPKFQPEPISC
ncbi:unnamed protein product [Ixodes pacificus]